MPPTLLRNVRADSSLPTSLMIMRARVISPVQWVRQTAFTKDGLLTDVVDCEKSWNVRDMLQSSDMGRITSRNLRGK